MSLAKFKVEGVVESIRHPRDKITVVVVEVDASFKKKDGTRVTKTSLIPVECFGDWEHDLVSGVSVGDTVSIDGEVDGRDWNGKVFSTLKPKKVTVTANAPVGNVPKGAQADDGFPF